MKNWIFDFHLQQTLQTKQHRFQLDVKCESAVQRLAIIGASGSGKSLTLRLLAGLEKLQRGHICIGRQDYTNAPPQCRSVGLMFQDYALFPHLTIVQNVAFGRHQSFRQPPKNPDETTLFWLEKMQLMRVMHHYPHQISGGQKQRVALARTCVANPKWLLLDEPFSALDTTLRQEMREWVSQLQRELAIPLLLVTHDALDTEVLADEILRMDNGKLLKE